MTILGGGCYLHGPYDPDADIESIAQDFLVFCLLAARREVLPAGWDWTAFFKVAAKFAGFAFEKSDAQTRWGSENVFSEMMGGRSLRATAVSVYGSNAQDQKRSTQEKAAKKHADLWLDAGDGNNKYLEEVGGLKVWCSFVMLLEDSRH